MWAGIISAYETSLPNVLLILVSSVLLYNDKKKVLKLIWAIQFEYLNSLYEAEHVLSVFKF